MYSSALINRSDKSPDCSSVTGLISTFTSPMQKSSSCRRLKISSSRLAPAYSNKISKSESAFSVPRLRLPYTITSRIWIGKWYSLIFIWIYPRTSSSIRSAVIPSNGRKYCFVFSRKRLTACSVSAEWYFFSSKKSATFVNPKEST